MADVRPSARGTVGKKFTQDIREVVRRLQVVVYLWKSAGVLPRHFSSLRILVPVYFQIYFIGQENVNSIYKEIRQQ